MWYHDAAHPDDRLLEFGYDEKSNVLQLKFKYDGVYNYYNVPKEKYFRLKEAEHKEGYYVRNIENVYQRRHVQTNAPYLLCIALGFSVLDLPAEIHVLLRFLICPLLATFAYQKYKQGRIWQGATYAGFAGLFNPFVRVHLNSDIWQMLEIANLLFVMSSSVQPAQLLSRFRCWCKTVLTGLLITILGGAVQLGLLSSIIIVVVFVALAVLLRFYPLAGLFAALGLGGLLWWFYFHRKVRK